MFMNLTELQKKISEVLGVSESEKELAYEVMISKIVEIITEGITLKIPRIGYFQLKKNDDLDEYSLIFSSFQDPIQTKADELYLVLNATSYVKNSLDIDDNVFSIGVAKPLIPLDKLSDSDSDTSYTILRKSIEERVNEILTESDQLPYFNMWEKFSNTVEKNKIAEIQDSKTKLEELTADLDFKEDFFVEEITHNLLNMDVKKIETETDEIGNNNLPEISPSELLEDYKTDLENSIENSVLDSENEIDKTFEKSNIFNEDIILSQEVLNDEKIKQNEIIQEEITLLEPTIEEQNESVFDKENLNFDLNEISPKEIEIELGRKSFIDEKINDNEYITSEAQVENKKDIPLKEPEDTGDTEFLDVDIEEESYLGLKKKNEEKIEWNWGDELKEEFGTTTEFDSPSFDFMDEEEFEERDTLSNMFKKNKPEKGTMFDELEKSIKKEVEKTDKEIEYMEYSGPPPKYEFVEEGDKEHRLESEQNQPSSTIDSYYEDEIMNEYKNNTKDKYFNKSFIAIFSSFIVIIALIIYLLLPGKKTNKELTDLVDSDNFSSQNSAPTNTIPIDTQTSTSVVEESDFPRVASVPVKDSPSGTTVSPVKPIQQSNLNNLYRNITNDQRVNKTIFYDGSEYNIQVSSWRNKEKAEQEVRRLRNKGYNSFVLIANLPEKGGTWYRVRIGSLKSQKEAEELITKNNF